MIPPPPPRKMRAAYTPVAFATTHCRAYHGAKKSRHQRRTMRVKLVTIEGEPLGALDLPEIPRAGDSLTFQDRDGGEVIWRVSRAHWPINPAGCCEGPEVRLTSWP